MAGKICIAIDGPAGAGKSSVARLVAGKLAYIYIDTGAMYRALTWKAIHCEIELEDGSAIRELLEGSKIELIPGDLEQRVLLNGEDVSKAIRTSQVTNQVSVAAKHEQVREDMVERQRSLAKEGGVVMDGRDIGTHVLPTAEVKIFLTASVGIRAQRRHLENLQKGFPSDLGQMEADIALRDRRDTQRKASPLIKAQDAVEIDTTDMNIEEVAAAILNFAAERTE